MPETIETVRETAKTECILREKAVRANLAIDYDIDSVILPRYSSRIFLCVNSDLFTIDNDSSIFSSYCSRPGAVVSVILEKMSIYL